MPVARSEKPRRPRCKMAVVNDVTTEKLAGILGDNPRGLLRQVDELTAFIRMLDAYHGVGRGADRQTYPSIWSGAPFQVDRKSGEPVAVGEPFLNLLGGIQPEMLGTLADGRGRDDGLLDRFLFSYPAQAGRRDWTSPGISDRARESWAALVEWLLGLAMEEPPADDPTSGPRPRTIRLAEDADRAWAEWHRRHWDETEWDCFPAHLRGLWSKFETHAFVLVLVVHLLRVASAHALGGEPYDQVDPPIDGDSMRRGLALADYFKDHNVRVLDRLKASAADQLAERVVAWIKKRPGRRATARQLQSHNVAGIKTASEARAALKDLEDRALVVRISAPAENRNGQVVDWYQAN